MQAPVEFCQASSLHQGAGDGGHGLGGGVKICGSVHQCFLVKHFEHIWVVQLFARHTDALEESKIKKAWFSVRTGGSQPSVPS